MPFLRPGTQFRELEEFRRNIDDMLEHLRGKTSYSIGRGLAARKPPMESFVEEGKLIVRAELPGIEPKDITVNVVDNILTIRALRQEEYEAKQRDFLHREFRYGAVERSITLPEGVETEDIKANFKNGLLQLTISIPEETVPKKIHVEHAELKASGGKPG